MAHAVARALGIDPPTAEIMASCYRESLSAWRRHVADARRQAMAWRFAAVVSMALCTGLAGSLSLTLTRPAMALHVVDGLTPSRISSEKASSLLEPVTMLPSWQPNCVATQSGVSLDEPE
jgi:hypothetical protein